MLNLNNTNVSQFQSKNQNTSFFRERIYKKNNMTMSYIFNSPSASNVIYFDDSVVKNESKIDVSAQDADFDWKYYIQTYSDLRDSGIFTREKAYEHWMNYGMKEGRLPKSPIIEPEVTEPVQSECVNKNESEFSEFDWIYYLSYNTDLVRNYGITSKEGAYNHWNTVGKTEGRVASNDDLKLQYYKMINGKSKNFNMNKITSYAKYIARTTGTLESEKLKQMQLRSSHFVKDKIQFPPRSFILIIDFPVFGGGTTFFLNVILSKYKDTQDFVIARNFNGNVYFYLNDEVMINDAYIESESILFIKYYKPSISKIFVNSLIGHTDAFLKEVFSLEKEVTGITHDYSLLFDHPQLLYCDVESMKRTAVIDIARFNKIITQNERNLSIYNKHINRATTDLIICPLPDFKTCCERINTNNSKIVIGVLGYISDVKGQYIVRKLISLAEKNDNLDVIVFGRVNMFYEKQYEYNSIEELNYLLTLYKPNLWVETSLWSETYSYTLTIMMLTHLPIFYQKKTFPSTIESRLASYTDAEPFDNIETVMDSDIISKRQDYFYTIEPKIYFNEFWDNYFTSNVNINAPMIYNIVFISSKIYTSSASFTYTEKRSIYTTEQRFRQTVETINSIRKHIPNSFIILFDNSSFDIKEFNLLNKSVDVFINNQSDKNIQYHTNVNSTKLYGELAQTAFVVKYIEENLKHMKIQNFFKISGRYLINDTFDYSRYENTLNIFKKNATVTDRDYYYTSFYKIGCFNLVEYFNVINNLYKNSGQRLYDNCDWEVILPMKLKYNFSQIDNLGITQCISAWNQVDSI